jgi:lipoyl synthase
MRLSIGSAARLGLVDMYQLVEPTTCYVMIGDRCENGCDFCSQCISDDRLSRIEWLEFDDEEAISLINRSDFRRVCLQCTSGGLPHAKNIMKTINKPISVSANLTSMDDVMRLSTADRICMPLDVANNELYQELKHGSFDERMVLLKQASRKFPGKIMTHLIIGLGENEEEAGQMLRTLRACGVGVGLFSFTPVPGTPLADRRQPLVSYYRRMQKLNFLLRNTELTSLAYQTSGCPGCNRPFYNERVSGPLYNFPRPLSPEEFAQCNGA